MRLGSGILKYDIRLYGSMPRSLLLIRFHTMANACGGLITFITLIAPFLLYTQGRQQIKTLQQSRSKAKVPFFWAVASLAHVFNVYMTYNALVVICFRPGCLVENERNACLGASCGVIYTLLTMCSVAYFHSKYITFPIPRTWDVFPSRCCGGKQYRVIRMLSILGIYYCIVLLSLCFPVQLLLVSTNPHLYGIGILTVWCAMFVCIIITSIPFTIDQIFIKEEEYRITSKQALRQILLLMFIAVLVFGFGSLTFSISLLIRLNKYGTKTHSLTKSWSFILQHTAVPILFWIVKRVLQRVNVKRLLLSM